LAPRTLVLVLTRRCQLRCTYCPVVKGSEDMHEAVALRALRLFVDLYGGGDVKLFGGEPLLAPRVARAVIAAADREPAVRRVLVSTNGVALGDSWRDDLLRARKTVVVLSLDGTEADHAALRSPPVVAADGHRRVLACLPRLVRAGRVLVNQVIAPSTASRAATNFEYLLGLGVRRVNLLPASYVAWTAAELEALREGLAGIRRRVAARWARGERLYVRNVFVRAPQPLFAEGVVVDSDGSIFPSDCILSDVSSGLRAALRCGSVGRPPRLAELRRRSREADGLLEAALAPEVLAATHAVDRELSGFARALLADLGRSPRGREGRRAPSGSHRGGS
jgi:sulfatase maturation enzyme AslB (radical SAM superfamily)